MMYHTVTIAQTHPKLNEDKIVVAEREANVSYRQWKGGKLLSDRLYDFDANTQTNQRSGKVSPISEYLVPAWTAEPALPAAKCKRISARHGYTEIVYGRFGEIAEVAIYSKLATMSISHLRLEAMLTTPYVRRDGDGTFYLCVSRQWLHSHGHVTLGHVITVRMDTKSAELTP